MATGNYATCVTGSTETTNVDGTSTVFYIIQVESPLKKNWTLHRRYSEFHHVYEILKENFKVVRDFNFPPKITMFQDSKAVASQRAETFNNFCQLMAGLRPYPPVVEEFFSYETNLRPRDTSFLLLEEISEAEQAILAKSAPRCGHCGEAVIKKQGKYTGLFFKDSKTNGTVHEECWEAYKRKTSGQCLHCNGLIVCIPGKISGEYFETEEGGKVHTECWESYCLATYVKCAHCQAPCCQWKEFSGDICDIGGKSVHEECVEFYMSSLFIKMDLEKPNMEKVAVPDCVHCGVAVQFEAGKFSGRSRELKGEARVHEECWEDYFLIYHCWKCRTALNDSQYDGTFHLIQEGRVHTECWENYCRGKFTFCVYCKEPCCEFGRYTGMVYDYGNGVECHLECFGAYSRTFVKNIIVRARIPVEDVANVRGLTLGGKVDANCQSLTVVKVRKAQGDFLS